MSKTTWLIAGAGLLVVGSLAAWVFLGSGVESPETLFKNALTASTPKAKINAASRLTMLPADERVLPLVRRLATESTDSPVLVISLNRLASVNDSESLPILISNMDNADKSVRESAYDGTLRFLGGRLPQNLAYKVDDPQPSRQKVVQKLKQISEDKTPMPPG